MSLYIKYIRNPSYFNLLKTLRPLSFDEISLYYEPYKVFLLIYYKYFNYIYKNYNITDYNTIKYIDIPYIYILAIYIGNIDFLKYLYNIYEINITNNYKEIYYMAAKFGNIKTLKYFNTFSIDIYNTITKYNDMYGINPYLAAIMHGKFKTVKYLEKCGFDINIKDNNDDNAFILAAEFGRVKIMKYLISIHNFDINYKNKYNRNAFTASLRNDKIQVIKYLLQIGCNINQIDVYGNNNYYHCYYNGRFNIKSLKYLDSIGHDIYTKNIYNETFQTLVKNYGHSKLFKYLIKNNKKNLINKKAFFSYNISNVFKYEIKYFSYIMNIYKKNIFKIYLFI